MGLVPVDAGGPGGMVYCEYADTVTGLRHSVRFYVAPFDPAPTGLGNDHLYTHAGPWPPSESGVLATVAAVGALWQQYYPDTFIFYPVAVARNADGVLTTLRDPPLAAPLAGTAAGTLPPGISYKRIFKVGSKGDKNHWIVWHQMPGS